MTKVSFLIVDDHARYRRILRQFILRHSDWHIVAEATDGEAALRMAQDYQPEVILMDVMMPKVNRLEATRRIKAATTTIRIVLFSGHRYSALKEAAQKAGPDAFFWKEELGRQVLYQLIEQWF
jgi:DNA-binding NarL/FixJ family response regulator